MPAEPARRVEEAEVERARARHEEDERAYAKLARDPHVITIPQPAHKDRAILLAALAAERRLVDEMERQRVALGEAHEETLRAANTLLAAERQRGEGLERALRWAWKYGEERLRPWEAWTDSNGQVTGWHCWGCGGEFLARWPKWIEPTDETFPHKPNCGYVDFRAALAAPAAEGTAGS